MRSLLLILLIGCTTLAHAFHKKEQSPSSVKTLLYKINFRTTVKTGFNILGNNISDTTLEAKIAGNCQIILLKTTSSGHILFFRFDGFTTFHFPLPAKTQEQVRKDLLAGCFFLQNNNGLIDSLYFPENISAAAEQLITQIMECYQVYQPDNSQVQWQKNIALNDGMVTAIWSGYPKGNAGKRIQLTKMEALSENASPAKDMVSKRNFYSASLSWDFEDGNLQQLIGYIERQLKINHQTVTTLLNTIQLEIQQSQKAPTSVIQKDNYTYRRSLYYTGKLLQKKQQDIILKAKALSITSLLQAVRLNDIEKEENMRDRLTENIRFCFLAGKDSLELFREALMQAAPDNLSFKTLRAGIASAATPFAQQLLCDYVRKYRTDPLRMKRIIPSIGLVRTPGYNLQQELEILAYHHESGNDIVAAACLALGNMAGNLRNADSLRANSIVARLAIALTPKDDDYLLLSALGNGGAASSLPYIMHYLSDTTAAIRGYAYYTMRFFNSPEVDDLFMNGLHIEYKEEVVEYILNAFVFRKPKEEWINELYKKSISAPSEKIAQMSLKVLFQWSYDQPQLLNRIRQIATESIYTKVKDIAAEFCKNIN